MTVRLLLDTHVLLWWLSANRKLKPSARAAIETPENLIFVSAASIWELRIKESLGKVALPADFTEALNAEAFEHLPVTAVHAHTLRALPMHHRDPFDRMLVAQALIEGLTIVTHDEALHAYDVPIMPA
jgi:PIN domain nuclease of toxin-antitoxin system